MRGMADQVRHIVSLEVRLPTRAAVEGESLDKLPAPRRMAEEQGAIRPPGRRELLTGAVAVAAAVAVPPAVGQAEVVL